MFKGPVIFIFVFTFTLFSCSNSSEKTENKNISTDTSALKNTGPLFSFEENDKTGFKNSKGEVVIPAKFQVTFTDTFDHKIAFVADSGGNFIAIDKKGNKVLSPYIYDNGPDYIVDGLFRFVDNKKIGFADADGSIIIPAKYDFVTEFKEGLACFGNAFTLKQEGEISLMKGGKWGFIDHKGDTVIAQEYDEMAYFEDGKCSVKKKGERLIIDKSGKVVK